MKTSDLRYIFFGFLLANFMFTTCSKSPKSKKTKSSAKPKPNHEEHGLSDFSIKCPGSKKAFKTTPVQTKLIPLIDIESNDCTANDILSKKNNNLFFVESSGRNHLRVRDACAIESAVKNSGLAGHIIVAMTSPFLDVMANNATCHIYTEHEGKNVFFRHVNVDTIFEGTPIHQLHLEGKLKHTETRETIVQYR